MDALELLSELGHVESADQAVLDAALRELSEAVSQDAHHARIDRRASRRANWLRPRLVTATAVAVALTAAATYTVVIGLGHHVSPIRSERSGLNGQRPPSAGARPGAPTIAAVLTAASASSRDILEVTKTMRGDEGTLGKTVIRVWPADPTPGTPVRTSIVSYSLAGRRQADEVFTYTASSGAPATAGSRCDDIFRRPRIADPPAAGSPGTLTNVNYRWHFWAEGPVVVQAATTPSVGALRRCLTAGQWRVSGRGVVAGVKAIELITSGGGELLWVNAATFLPLRLVITSPDGQETLTFAFGFLSPTPANQALLAAPVIPAGYTRGTI
jgi:hypothetical protein